MCQETQVVELETKVVNLVQENQKLRHLVTVLQADLASEKAASQFIAKLAADQGMLS